jgi:hypothetical protein
VASVNIFPGVQPLSGSGPCGTHPVVLVCTPQATLAGGVSVTAGGEEVPEVGVIGTGVIVGTRVGVGVGEAQDVRRMENTTNNAFFIRTCLSPGIVVGTVVP